MRADVGDGDRQVLAEGEEGRFGVVVDKVYTITVLVAVELGVVKPPAIVRSMVKTSIVIIKLFCLFSLQISISSVQAGPVPSIPSTPSTLFVTLFN